MATPRPYLEVINDFQVARRSADDALRQVAALERELLEVRSMSASIVVGDIVTLENKSRGLVTEVQFLPSGDFVVLALPEGADGKFDTAGSDGSTAIAGVNAKLDPNQTAETTTMTMEVVAL